MPLTNKLKSDYSKLVSDYQAGATVKSLAKMHGVSTTTILNHLRASGKYIPNRDKSRGKYSVDCEYFANIDSTDKAYWLGFIFADGWVIETKCGYLAFGIELKDSDRPHLELLAKCAGITRPISTRTRHIWDKDFTTHAIGTGNGEFSRHLVRKGIVSTRKDIGLALSFVPVELRPHFWRGMVDGDGYVRISNRGDPEIGLVGDSATCEAFREYSMKLTRTRMLVHPQRTIFQFKLQGACALLVINSLYGCGGPVLRRKADIVSTITGAL